MKLEWRQSGDGDRWFANVAERQLIITRSFVFGWWYFEWQHFSDYQTRREAKSRFWNREFMNAETAKVAVENWWNSTTAQGEKAGER